MSTCTCIVLLYLKHVNVYVYCFEVFILDHLKKAFTTYIRPLLEYNFDIWNQTRVYFSDLLESVQRGFTKRVNAIYNLPYIERLDIFNLEPLEVGLYVDCAMIWYKTTKY